jgi:hypothetical protein
LIVADVDDPGTFANWDTRQSSNEVSIELALRAGAAVEQANRHDRCGGHTKTARDPGQVRMHR